MSFNVNDTFESIQGEGPFIGTPALFIRMAGCNLSCPYCDTEHKEVKSKMKLQDVAALLETTNAPLVVITGGEPLLEDGIASLCSLILDRGKIPQIETNGTIDRDVPDGTVIVISPKNADVKLSTANNVRVYAKYVLQAGHIADDGLPLDSMGFDSMPSRLNLPPALIYVMPLDEKDPMKNLANEQACVASAMKHNYRLTVQLHKWLDIK